MIAAEPFVRGEVRMRDGPKTSRQTKTDLRRGRPDPAAKDDGGIPDEPPDLPEDLLFNVSAEPLQPLPAPPEEARAGQVTD